MEPYSNLENLQKEIFSGKINCVQLVERFIERIEKKKSLNIFLEVFEKTALDLARKIDKKIKNNSAGGLAGLIVGIKDNICYKGHCVSASSKILNGFESTYSATVIEKLLAEDAIIIGRINCDEFAMGSTNENSAYGPVKNPLNSNLTPGGSSGGCAAAIVANLCHVSLGSDTGGSIRQPASFCSIIGFKPSYGMVSRHGLIAYASSFDQIGPMGKSIQDIDRVMEVISGKDNFDSTCVFDKADYKIKTKPPKKINICVIKDASEHKLLHKDVKKSFAKLLHNLKNAGHNIKEFEMPILKYLVPAYYILTTAEASSNLARYDGIKYGYSKGRMTKNWSEIIKQTRSRGFGKEVKRRILLGTFVLSEGYYDNYYSKAQKIRRLVQKETEKILQSCDFILLPTSPTIPFKLKEKHNDPTVLYLQDVFTVQANLSGNPAISIPIFQYKNDAPVGGQLIGKKGKDKELLHFGNEILKNHV